ncbi:MAG TPA: carboxypeptidase regulatory-like domain-containing protein [Euryarchaeota archaeon]|nr:carboxypeptidase regulatory-like domain-containing protein [Euryarchaeota archaeon]
MSDGPASWKYAALSIVAVTLLMYYAPVTHIEGSNAITLQGGTGTLIVNVTDEAGRLIPYATVAIYGNSTTFSTGADGSVMIPDLPEGIYQVNASKLGYIEDTLNEANIAEGGTTYLDPLILGGGSVFGYVYAANASSMPISGATVRLVGAALFGFFVLETQSAGNGYYSITGIPTGKYSLEGSAVGYMHTSQTIDITAYEDREIILRLDYNYGSISGFVLEELDPLPLPLSRVNVSLTVGSAKITVATDLFGRYTTPQIPPGSYEVTAEKTGYFTGSVEGVLVENGRMTENANISLVSKPGKIFGTVTSGAILVSGATVELEGIGLNSTTGYQGTYSIEDIPAGTYTIVTTAPGYDINRTINVGVERGKEYRLDIVLDARPGQLLGYVKSSEDFSVIPNCNVTITGSSESRMTVTNEQGIYIFAGLPVGNYTLVVRTPGYSPYIVSDIEITPDTPSHFDVYLDLEKEALSGFIFGMDLAHSLMALAFLFSIVILSVAVYLRLRGLQYPEKSPAVFEEEAGEEEEEE